VASTYLTLLRAQLRSQAQYRGSFAVDLAGSFLFGAVDLASVFVLFSVARSLGGFDFDAVLLMASLAGTAFALADLCVGNIDTMQRYIRSGRLDALLVRPLGVLGQLVTTDFAPRRAGRLVVMAVALVVAAARAPIDWGPARVVLAVVAPLAGALLFASVFVSTAIVAFWWVDSGKLGDGVTYGGKDFTVYPMSVYNGWFQKLFAYGLGFAFVSYYPSLALLDRADPLGLPPVAGWLAPLAGLGALAVARFAWRQGIRRYTSTGS
jgi:ABC-2 type transport system permease protein